MNTSKTEVLDFESSSLSRPPLDEFLAGSVPMPTADPVSDAASQFSSPALGKIVAVAKVALVDFPGNPGPEPLQAKQICQVNPADVGREAVLLFENNDCRRPIIVGLLQAPVSNPGEPEQPLHVSLDGEQVTLSAKNEIVLRCGKASITLTRAGKVVIRGAYLLSRSSGVNRIKGGSVQIN